MAGDRLRLPKVGNEVNFRMKVMGADTDGDIDATILISEKQTEKTIKWDKVPVDIGLWKGAIGSYGQSTKTSIPAPKLYDEMDFSINTDLGQISTRINFGDWTMFA